MFMQTPCLKKYTYFYFLYPYLFPQLSCMPQLTPLNKCHTASTIISQRAFHFWGYHCILLFFYVLLLVAASHNLNTLEMASCSPASIIWKLARWINFLVKLGTGKARAPMRGSRNGPRQVEQRSRLHVSMYPCTCIHVHVSMYKDHCRHHLIAEISTELATEPHWLAVGTTTSTCTI